MDNYVNKIMECIRSADGPSFPLCTPPPVISECVGFNDFYGRAMECENIVWVNDEYYNLLPENRQNIKNDCLRILFLHISGSFKLYCLFHRVVSMIFLSIRFSFGS